VVAELSANSRSRQRDPDRTARTLVLEDHATVFVSAAVVAVSRQVPTVASWIPRDFWNRNLPLCGGFGFGFLRFDGSHPNKDKSAG
jgi:hypothetical protein